MTTHPALSLLYCNYSSISMYNKIVEEYNKIKINHVLQGWKSIVLYNMLRPDFQSAKVVPLSGKVVPLSGKVVPLSGKVVPLSAKVLPLSGKVVTQA
jgi:hypothetical protein